MRNDEDRLITCFWSYFSHQGNRHRLQLVLWLSIEFQDFRNPWERRHQWSWLGLWQLPLLSPLQWLLKSQWLRNLARPHTKSRKRRRLCIIACLLDSVNWQLTFKFIMVSHSDCCKLLLHIKLTNSLLLYAFVIWVYLSRIIINSSAKYINVSGL